MKNRNLIVAILMTVMLMFASVALCAMLTTPTGSLTTSQQIRTGSGLLTGCLVITDGTNSFTVTLYDGTSSSGIMLAKFPVSGASNFGGGTWEVPVAFGTGLYASVSGTPGAFIVYYNAGQ